VGVVFGYTGLTLLFTYPLAMRFASELIGRGNDLWIFQWNNWRDFEFIDEIGDGVGVVRAQLSTDVLPQGRPLGGSAGLGYARGTVQQLASLYSVEGLGWEPGPESDR
jgi:hypothetical protein